MSEFDEFETTKVTPEKLQEELIEKNIDTDPVFENSEFWFRFQHMEQEITALRDSYRVIYSIMKIHWDKPEDVEDEHLKMIFSIARDIVEGIPPDEDIITITT